MVWAWWALPVKTSLVEPGMGFASKTQCGALV
jgi:hypothetical protein